MKPGRVAFANTAGINLSHCYIAIKAAPKERLLWIIPRLSMPKLKKPRAGGARGLGLWCAFLVRNKKPSLLAGFFAV